MAQEEFKDLVKRDVEDWVREGVKAVLEEDLQEEEITEHLGTLTTGSSPLPARESRAVTIGTTWLLLRARWSTSGCRVIAKVCS